MPSTTRRALLVTLGTAGTACVAGCSAPPADEIPAGGLQFVNKDVLPHELRMQVTAVGIKYDRDTRLAVGDQPVPRAIVERRTTAVVDAETSQTYEHISVEPVWYIVQFSIDGEVPEHGSPVRFHPPPNDGDPATNLGAKMFK